MKQTKDLYNKNSSVTEIQASIKGARESFEGNAKINIGNQSMKEKADSLKKQ